MSFAGLWEEQAINKTQSPTPRVRGGGSASGPPPAPGPPGSRPGSLQLRFQGTLVRVPVPSLPSGRSGPLHAERDPAQERPPIPREAAIQGPPKGGTSRVNSSSAAMTLRHRHRENWSPRGPVRWGPRGLAVI